jgi:Peptidase family M28
MKTLYATLVLAGSLLAQDGDPAPALLPDVKAAVDRVSREDIETTVRTLASFGTRHTLSETRSETRGIGAARAWLLARMEEIAAGSGGRMMAEAQKEMAPVGRRIREPTELWNVLGIIEGSDKNRVIVVSGHYDSIPSDAMDPRSDAPGANDDASGTAVSFACARALASEKTRATVIFAAVAGEEQGLVGAALLAQKLLADEQQVAFMITNDIVGGATGSNGRREPNVLRCFSEGVPTTPTGESRPARTVTGSDNDAPSRQVARYLAARGPLYVPGFEVRMVFRQDRYLRGGDHKAFNDLGLPAIRLTEPNENYDWQHQNVREENGRKYGDRFENVDLDYVRKVAQVNAAAILEAALAPASPRQVRMDVTKLTPHTTLRWAKSPEPDLAGYAVLWRLTHEPTWTHRRVVPKDQTEVTLEGLSKDDWLFAVEAFDERGHRSVPVYPVPQMRAR